MVKSKLFVRILCLILAAIFVISMMWLHSLPCFNRFCPRSGEYPGLFIVFFEYSLGY